MKVGDTVKARCSRLHEWREGKVVEYKKGGGSANAQVVVMPKFPVTGKLAFITFVQPSLCRLL